MTDNFIPINLTIDEIEIILNGMGLLLSKEDELNLNEQDMDYFYHIYELFGEFANEINE